MKLARRRLSVAHKDNRVDTIPWYLSGGVLASDCIAAYQPYGSVTLAGSYVNVVNPGTHDLTVGVAPELTANGWYSQYGNRYLISDILPSATMTVIARVLNINNYYPAGRICGASDAGGAWGISGVESGFILGYYNGTAAGRYGNVIGTTSFTGTTAMAGKRAFSDGVFRGLAGGVGTIPNLPLWIMRDNSATNNYIRNTLMLLSFYSVTLSDTQVSAISAAATAWEPSLVADSSTDWILTA